MRAAEMNARPTDTPKKRLEYVFGETAKGNGQPFLDALADDAEWTVIGNTGWFALRGGQIRSVTEYADTELIRSVLGDPASSRVDRPATP
jgi:ketosteroid isomerase-like protein